MKMIERMSILENKKRTLHTQFDLVLNVFNFNRFVETAYENVSVSAFVKD